MYSEWYPSVVKLLPAWAHPPSGRYETAEAGILTPEHAAVIRLTQSNSTELTKCTRLLHCRQPEECQHESVYVAFYYCVL